MRVNGVTNRRLANKRVKREIYGFGFRFRSAPRRGSRKSSRLNSSVGTWELARNATVKTPIDPQSVISSSSSVVVCRMSFCMNVVVGCVTNDQAWRCKIFLLILSLSSLWLLFLSSSLSTQISFFRSWKRAHRKITKTHSLFVKRNHSKTTKLVDTQWRPFSSR